MELFRWIRWQWREFDIWQRFAITAMVLFIVSAFSPAPYDKYIWFTGMFIVCFFASKLFIWDGIKHSYGNYKKQRDTLFNKIRGE